MEFMQLLEELKKMNPDVKFGIGFFDDEIAILCNEEDLDFKIPEDYIFQEENPAPVINIYYCSF